MAKAARPRRSILYMPGSNARALEKGKGLPADGLILDLEDSVAPDAKEAARAQVAAVVKGGGFGKREIIIRTNGIGTPWFEADVAAAAVCGPDAVLIPKVESAATIQAVERIFMEVGASSALPIWCMMETPRGMLRADEIASSSPRVQCLVLGTSDLAKELDCAHTRERLPMVTSLGLCMLAARAAGISILDGVFLDLEDDEGFEYALRQGAEFGFDGKTLIHPKTVEITNRVFTPSAKDVEWSRKIIAAHADAAAHGKGVVVVDGKLIENLHVESARRLVARAEAIEEMAASHKAGAAAA